MCGVCGCSELGSQAAGNTLASPRPALGELSATRLVRVEQQILAANDQYAQANRRYFNERQLLTLNLLSSPGAGKTTLLTRTIRDLQARYTINVIEGDQQTDRDAARVRAAGAQAVQINTGKGCHLDARGIGRALADLPEALRGILFIENVGNLVCPAGFDLGEHHKVVILSVTEGDDKPLKYPDAFYAADLMIINKMDLLPHVDFNIQQCIEFARRVNPGIEIIQVSALTGQGFAQWHVWLELARNAILKHVGASEIVETDRI